MGSDNTPGRGRDVVEAALIEAAAELLAEQGPAKTSVRDIADRAGVNRGQIHHYFGGKQGLIEAAIRQLAHDHYENSTRTEDGWPQPLTLGLDEPYLQAVVRIILDGDLETAGAEFKEGCSVPRAVLDRLAAKKGLDEPDLQLKSEVAAAMALEMGWAAFESFILVAVGGSDDEADAIRDRLRLGLRQIGSGPRSKASTVGARPASSIEV